MTFKRDGNAVLGPGDFNRESEYVYVYTAFEMAATGVLQTRTALFADNVITSATLSATNSVVIDGVEYTADATYDNALWTEANLERATRFIRNNATLIAYDVLFVDANGSTPLFEVRLAGSVDSNGAFGTLLLNHQDGFWVAVFAVESTDNLAIASDTPNGIAAVTAVANVEADLTGTDLFFNTANADLNNEEAMAGSLAVGAGVDGFVSATERNLVVRVSTTPLA